MIRGRDRIWWLIKEQPALERLQQVGVWLSKVSPLNATLLTQDTYLAVESGLRVPAGLEMGPFSYYPDFPRARAEKLHVLNHEMLLELLQAAEAPYAALSGYSLAIRSPEIMPLTPAEREEIQAALHAHYAELLEIPAFGQAHTPLQILRRRDDAAPP